MSIFIRIGLVILVQAINLIYRRVYNEKFGTTNLSRQIPIILIGTKWLVIIILSIDYSVFLQRENLQDRYLKELCTIKEIINGYVPKILDKLVSKIRFKINVQCTLQF